MIVIIQVEEFHVSFHLFFECFAASLKPQQQVWLSYAQAKNNMCAVQYNLQT